MGLDLLWALLWLLVVLRRGMERGRRALLEGWDREEEVSDQVAELRAARTAELVYTLELPARRRRQWQRLAEAQRGMRHHERLQRLAAAPWGLE